jgi:hypothetical protein
VATVVPGTWYFGHETPFDEKGLKVLPAGSVYTEPPLQLHFAPTGDTPVAAHISGFWPTGSDTAGPRRRPGPSEERRVSTSTRLMGPAEKIQCVRGGCASP